MWSLVVGDDGSWGEMTVTYDVEPGALMVDVRASDGALPPDASSLEIAAKLLNEVVDEHHLATDGRHAHLRKLRAARGAAERGTRARARRDRLEIAGDLRQRVEVGAAQRAREAALCELIGARGADAPTTILRHAQARAATAASTSAATCISVGVAMPSI